MKTRGGIIIKNIMLQNIAKIFMSHNEMTPRNIRGSLWATILVFPLSVILGDLRYFDLTIQFLGLQSYELMLFPLGLGWLVLFFLPKRCIAPALRIAAALCAVVLPFQFLLTGDIQRLSAFMVFQFLNGVCAGAAFYLFCFVLNNVERFFNMALIQLYYGFYYTVWRAFPVVQAVGKTWGGAIVCAIYVIIALSCFRKNDQKLLSDTTDSGRGSAVPLVLGLNIVYYLIMCMINYVEWADHHVNSMAFGIGALAAVALIYFVNILVSRTALYSWLLFLVLSLLGLGALLFESRLAILSGSFAYGLGDGIGYIIIYCICAGAIKKSKSLAMFRLFCFVFFIQYAVISGILSKVYENLEVQSNVLAFGIVIVLCGICFILSPVIQRRLFETPWTDGLNMVDMVEYAPALEETEKLDEQEHLCLTPREQEVFTLLLTDASRKQIADVLHISHSSIDFHSRNLYRKLGIQSRVELLTKYKK